MGYIFEKSYDVSYNEIDFRGRLQLSRLLNYFDDCAVVQSEKLGVGVDALLDMNVTWFLYQWDIEIKRLPQSGESVKAITEPLDFYRFYATRRFELLDKNGDLMAKALSLWIFLDFEKRMPKKIPPEFAEKYGCYPQDKKLSSWDVRSPTKEDYSLEVISLPVNMDTNQHINQAVYIDWAISSLPIEFLKNSTPLKLKSMYKKEAMPLEKIKVLTELNNSQSLHKISSASNGSDLCMIEIEWQRLFD